MRRRASVVATFAIASGLAVAAAAPAGASGYRTCAITGTNGNDVINGTSAGEVICGLDGGDIINGGYGDDIIRGGDSASVDAMIDRVNSIENLS